MAPQYRQLRELDVEAVERVAAIIRPLTRTQRRLTLVDVGAGTGRYTEAVLAALDRASRCRCHVIEYDATREMLEWGTRAQPPTRTALERVVGFAEELPFASATFNVLLSFNALHHFGLPAFAAEAARVVRPGGRVVLYTRTPEQNRRTLWGRFFPHFAQREFRLYTEETLRTKLKATGAFTTVRASPVPWTLSTNLGRLLRTARLGCYSTFAFYSEEEFERALRTFRRRLRAHFSNPSAITGRNDHLLVEAARR